jgi:hypothetical protein
MGAGDLSLLRRASLDPRSFAVGRANRLIEVYGLTGDQQPGEKDADYKARLARAEAYAQEGFALAEKLNATLPKPTGTPRNPKAKPLTPTVTTIRKV